MRVGARYSHLNGEEYLLVHQQGLWEEVQSVIASVDAFSCRTKVSQEKTMMGKRLYSPEDMNESFKRGFESLGWQQRRNTFWVTDNEKLLRGIYGLSEREQKAAIEAAGHTPIMSYNQCAVLRAGLAECHSAGAWCSRRTTGLDGRAAIVATLAA